MRFTIDKEQFLKSLNAASKAVPSKSASPYLTNLKLELNEKGLEILGSNGDISIKATTTEKLGFTGREEGISAYAVVLIEKV